MTCPTCHTPMLDAMIGVTLDVYRGPSKGYKVRAWVCPASGCGVRFWRDRTIELPALSPEYATVA